MSNDNDNDNWMPQVSKSAVVKWTVAAVLFLALCTGVSYATHLFGFWVDTQVNNRYVQPLQRSRLNSDANYKRSIEQQAQGLVSLYNKHKAALPADQKAISDFLAHNREPWSFQQTSTYNNLQATLTDDQQGIAQAATDYNSLVANPDNDGLLAADPSLPANLDPTIPTPVK